MEGVIPLTSETINSIASKDSDGPKYAYFKASGKGLSSNLGGSTIDGDLVKDGLTTNGLTFGC